MVAFSGWGRMVMARSIWFHRRNYLDHNHDNLTTFMVLHLGLIAVVSSPLERFGIDLHMRSVWPVILCVIGLILSIIGYFVLRKIRTDIESRFKLVRRR